MTDDPLDVHLAMSKILIGYVRCSIDKQDLAPQPAALIGLGVDPKRIYIDHGLTGTNRLRPSLDQAFAAVRGGDMFSISRPTVYRTLARAATAM